jgi:putative DNA-invertase from lambdoid prophage Rac
MGSATAFGYVRVSTREQDEGYQASEITRFAERLGYTLTRIYVDKMSGGIPFQSRESARRLLDQLEAEKPSAILVWSIDRIGRNMADTVSVVQSLEERGIRVLSVKEEWLQAQDIMVRKLILSILAWFAEYERSRMRERREAAWAAGKQKGRPKAVSDDVLRRYLIRYGSLGIKLKDIWKIMRNDEKVQISYSRFAKRVKALSKTVIVLPTQSDPHSHPPQ